MTQFDLQSRQWGWLVLFASLTTLICCALPIFLVLVGLGALSAALFANLPFLIFLAQHESWLFTLSGSLIVVAAWVLYRPERVCSPDQDLARQCAIAKRWNKRLLWGSGVAWMVGFASTRFSVLLFMLLGR